MLIAMPQEFLPQPPACQTGCPAVGHPSLFPCFVSGPLPCLLPLFRAQAGDEAGLPQLAWLYSTRSCFSSIPTRSTRQAGG